MIQPIIYKAGKKGTPQQWTVEVVKNRYRSHSGQVGGKITINEWTTCEGKNTGKSNETTPNEQAQLEASALMTKKLETGYFDSLKKIHNDRPFEPMLARKWEDIKDKVTYPILSQPKLDGIRCVLKKDGMWSRTGKKINSCPHIYEDVKHLFVKDPNLILDGELYCDKLNNDFNKICSLVKKTKPTKEDLIESKNVIQYWVYDIPSVKDICTKRISKLHELDFRSKSVIKVITVQLADEKSVTKQLEIYIGLGFEGQILRVANSKYENKRSKGLLKHKTFTDEEFEVVSVEEGKGLKSKMIGSATLKNKKGQKFSSNFKLSHDELKEMFKTKDELVGKMVTVKYFNLTPDGIPRFPYIIGIRDYE